MIPVYYLPRLSTVETCPNCQHKITMIYFGPKGEQRQCLKCHTWFDFAVTDMAMPSQVARTIDVLQQHGLVNTTFHDENTLASGKHVRQFRLEFEMPNKWRNGAATVRWFVLPEKPNYQYLNKVWRRRVLNDGRAPAFALDATRDLTKRDQMPDLFISEVGGLDYQHAGRKHIRLEQSYSWESERESLILRVELSWHHDPKEGIQPPHPWDRD